MIAAVMAVVCDLIVSLEHFSRILYDMQFILDDIIADSSVTKCRIVVTQPRRLAAIGVATRVAEERCEDIGNTVGYQVCNPYITIRMLIIMAPYNRSADPW